jgi:hypothetical protein
MKLPYYHTTGRSIRCGGPVSITVTKQALDT